MAFWTQVSTRPAGALPPNLVTKAGIILITVLLLGLIVSVSITGGGEDEAAAEIDPGQQQTIGEGVEQRLQTQVDESARREELARLAAERTAERERIQVAAVAGLQEAGVLEGEEVPVFDPVTGDVLDPDEGDLRRGLRLEEIERRIRSLRAGPVVLSFRDPDDAGFGGVPESELAALLDEALQGQDLAGPGANPLLDLLGGLPPEAFAEDLTGGLSLGDLSGAGGGGGYRPEPNALDVSLPTVATRAGDGAGQAPGADDPYANPARLITPVDPDGWERVYESSFIEAVLVTQLSGDFPSPVLAQVAVPFYSADRQRVLIPRGSRFVGTAQEVRNQDQERLAVAFHRLIFPDGSYLPLHFQGLNQAGEGALRDLVDRHYLSTFLAAGSVGILSGLTLVVANPFSTSTTGTALQSAGQGLGQAAQQIMSRFLNRMPTITIRAGHRLRIWFTSDVLLPSAGAAPPRFAPPITTGALP